MSSDEMAQRAYERLGNRVLAGPEGAVAILERALRRDPASPYRWCDLGEALLESGQVDRAKRCFAGALEYGPNLPPILIRTANFCFLTGETERAITYTTHILESVRDYDAAIFSLYDRMGVTTEVALRSGVPHSRRAARSYFRHLLATAPEAQTRLGWEWMRTSSFADDSIANEYVLRLLRARDYEGAADVWATHAGGREPGYRQTNCLFNGSFERAPSGSIFDWRIEYIRGAHAERDSTRSVSGKWALRIRFDGTEDVAYQQVSQRAVVRPGRYKFQAWLRAADISTDQGVSFRITDAESPQRLDIRTEPVRGTTEWTRRQLEFRVPTATHLLDIRVTREQSFSFDDKIRGIAWIDDAALTPLAAPAPRFDGLE